MKINNYIKRLIPVILVFVFFALLKIDGTIAIYKSTLPAQLTLNILDPTTSYEVSFLGYGGGDFGPYSKTAGQPLGTLPTPSLAGSNFIGWYTSYSGGDLVDASTLVTGPATYHARYAPIVCQKAIQSTLHTETCNRSTNAGCRLAGFANGATITYGTVAGVDPVAGNAYDCDVNNDGTFSPTTERFYFIRENEDENAVLIHYTNFDENGQTQGLATDKIYLYNDALTHLPDSSTWTNPNLVSMNGNVTRFISVDDLEVACGNTLVLSDTDYLDSCYYLVEKTKFADEDYGRSGIWLEENSSHYYRIHSKAFTVTSVDVTESSNGARPVIEIPMENLDGYRVRQRYRIQFNSMGGPSVSDELRYENQVAGTLPSPTWTNYRFDGWYADDQFNTLITPSTPITGNVTYYALWTDISNGFPIVFEQEGACVFNGSSAYITGSECSDYHDKYYIDTGIALFSNENYEKDFELGFTVVSYDPTLYDSSTGLGTQEHYQATLVNSKLENPSLTYPGFTFRRNNSQFQFTEKIEGVDASTTFTYVANRTFKIYRINKMIYYSVDDGTRVPFQDTTPFAHQFALTTWFGAYAMESDVTATGENSVAARHVKATLSNMYIKLGTYPASNAVHVIFDADGGTASQASRDVAPNSQIGDLPTATKPGFVFDGWYTLPPNERKIDATEIITEAVTFKAHYIPLVTVTFDADGGTASYNSVDIASGTSIVSNGYSLPTATKTGFVFDHWYTSGGVVVDGTEIITANTTYTAHYFTAITITFDADGGTASFNSKDIVVGTAIGDLPTATKPNFSFDGWYLDDGTYSNPVSTSTIFNAAGNVIAKWISDNNVARIGSEYFESLQDAVDRAVQLGTHTEIVVLKDINNENIVVPAAGDIEFNLQSYTVSNTTGIIIDNSGTIEIKNGYLLRESSNNGDRVIVNRSGGTLVISGGDIKCTHHQAIQNYGTMTMTGGKVWTISTANQGTINNEPGGIMNISGGQVLGSQRQSVYNDNGTLTISGNAYFESDIVRTDKVRGTIHNNAGTTNILGGTIISNSANNPAVLNNATMTIGTNDQSVDQTTPVLRGKKNGLKINSGKTVNFYDGIIKGITAAADAESRLVIDTTNGMQFVRGSEVIGTDTYYTLTVEYPIVSCNITFNGNGGTSSLASRTVNSGDPVGQLPTASSGNDIFVGWFDDPTGGNLIKSTTIVNADVTYYAHYSSDYLCKKATAGTLHTYSSTTFGQVPNGLVMYPGDAYDCNVNGDNTYDSATERFYYLTDDADGNAIFIYSNNTTQSGPACNATAVNYGTSPYASGPTTASSELPTTSQWTKTYLYSTPRQIKNENGTTSVNGDTATTYDYTGLAARFATIQEIKAATSSSINGTNNELSSYEFLLENTSSYGTCNANYWLETPKNAGNGVFIIDGANQKSDYSTSTAGVRPVIEVPLRLVERDGEIVEFDTMSTAMRTYFDNISSWSSGQTESSHSSFDTAMTNNLNTNNCVYFTGDNRESESGTNYCDQPKKYDTGVNGNVKVYTYDVDTGTVGSEATYVSSSTGLLYNMIPNQVYYWESATDSSVNGYVKPLGERRIISIDNESGIHKIRNVRDLGGIPVTYEDRNGVSHSGTIKYGKLYRGEKIWGGSTTTADDNTIQYFTKLGISNEMDLRSNSEVSASTEASLANNITTDGTVNTFEIIHYGIDFNGYIDKDNVARNYYSLARSALKRVMTEVVNGNDAYAMYFHCRIGADRTGTLAYLIEGILGASEEERYKDFELTVFFGLRERTRFYENKNTDHIKFNHLKQAVRDANQDGTENVVGWFLKGSADATEEAADKLLIDQFRAKMVLED